MSTLIYSWVELTDKGSKYIKQDKDIFEMRLMSIDTLHMIFVWFENNFSNYIVVNSVTFPPSEIAVITRPVADFKQKIKIAEDIIPLEEMTLQVGKYLEETLSIKINNLEG